MPSNDVHSEEHYTVAGSFFQLARLTTQDQPDGGDTWHISKKDWNMVMDEIGVGINRYAEYLLRDSQREIMGLAYKYAGDDELSNFVEVDDLSRVSMQWTTDRIQSLNEGEK